MKAIARLTGTVLIILLGAMLLGTASPVKAQDTGQPEFPGPSHFVRGAYQAGRVLMTNDFLRGRNQSGEPIDSFHSARVEFGWRTDGSRDWHHIYNFPTFGIGVYGADFFNDEELGTPTSLYGFYTWPLWRTPRWTFNLQLGFGLTANWEEYDPVNNPDNIAIGLGRSVHIEVGGTAEYRLARRWTLVGGITGTHFSNGGTQLPNHGLNVAGPILFLSHDTDLPVSQPPRRHLGDYPRGWDMTLTGSAGRRNLNLKFSDPALRDDYLNRNYLIGNLTVALGRRVAWKSRVAMGLDLAYDESVGDLIELDAYNNGYNAHGKTSDNFELGLFGGYEIIANRTHLMIHFAYKVLYKDIPGRLPAFYQRLGVKQFIQGGWFAGLNVRFHQLGSADNLEWNTGYAVGL
jgi:hypothetical protein